MAAELPFDNLYRHGFARVAVALPTVTLGDPQANAGGVLALASRAHDEYAAVVVFPELTLSGYSNDDLFHQSALLDDCRAALHRVAAESRDLEPLILVGCPLRVDQRLWNCAVALHRGEVLGVVPKSYLPNYREYYEKRWFVPARSARRDTLPWNGRSVPFGTDLVFEALGVPDLAVHAEICEDLWAPISPSHWGALAGATVLTNLSASNVTIDKAAFRRLLCRSQSGKLLAAYVYAGAGYGESTTDLAWDAHGMVCENGDLLAESERFSREPQLLIADLDLGRLTAERQRLSSFQDAILDAGERVRRFRRISFDFEPPESRCPLQRDVARYPFVPADPAALDERCSEAYAIQVQGLQRRLEATGIEKVVVGVSGGLDSTHALLVCAQAMDDLGLERADILAYTMPGFATSERTRRSAHRLMEALGVRGAEIDIRPAAEQMLRDIEHPYAAGEALYDTTFENVQAGERTSHLFRLANHHGGLVVGTGDLSELALGWTTYGVGDQMAHYNVNASVPKTLIQHLIRWVADRDRFGAEASDVLRDILETEISPELVPGDADSDGPHQRTEEVVGPFALQDFFLYFVTRYGYLPSKVAFLARHAWGDETRGDWPPGLPESVRRAYDDAEIRHWLEVFLDRFFRTSQFKRSAMPNGPKVGSGGSLSPRGDWRAPSDSGAAAWLRELEENVPD